MIGCVFFVVSAICPPPPGSTIVWVSTELNMSVFFFRLEEQNRRLQEIQPTVLGVEPIHLKALFYHVDYRSSAIVQSRVLINSGQSLDEDLRKRSRSDGDTEICNFYMATEFGEISAECSAHEGLHVNADLLILECLQDDQEGVPGQPSNVNITSLYSYSTPFIRYRLGDKCTLVKEPCPCGSSFPLIDPPLGRDDDAIWLPIGKILSAIRLSILLRKASGIGQHRFIQESPPASCAPACNPGKSRGTGAIGYAGRAC